MTDESFECEMCRGGLDFKDEPLWICDLKVSSAVLARNQICRGYCILIYSKGHYAELFQLSQEDLKAFMQDVATISRAIYQAFHPRKMNYELLGNVVPHLHWHIIPRRETDPIELRWPIWGKDYTMLKLSDEEYQQIIKEIRANLG
jgi:diadenosine tetraphosphate (Ap4A) HIT family hydrolase